MNNLLFKTLIAAFLITCGFAGGRITAKPLLHVDKAVIDITKDTDIFRYCLNSGKSANICRDEIFEHNI